MLPRFAAITFFSLLSLAGCVSTSDFDAMRADINQLKRDTFDLKKETSALSRDVGDIKPLVSGAAKEESFSALRESQTSLFSQVAEVSKDLQALRGRFDENKFFMDKTLKDAATEKELVRSQIAGLETRVKELNERLTKLSDAAASRPPAAETTETKGEAEERKEGPPGQKPGAREVSEDDPIRAYEAAYNLYKEKKYREAREKFNAFIKRFPKEDLTDNAQFWIGETYYGEKDFEGAILSYESLMKTYPQSEKIAPALLKQGLSFMELDDKKTAKVLFQKLIEKYPDSKEAEQAKKKISEIDKKPPKTKPKR